ncbi:putative tellurite resistance protein [Rhizobium phage RHph_I1_18]|nr:putative tellurite resistance protein [Rhizobium phage RHph_I1_18]
MGLFSNISNLLTAGANKVAGNTDYLEATSAFCALVAAADGNIEDSEFDATVNTIKNNKTIGKAFSEDKITTIVEKHLNQAKTRPGRLELRRELGDLKDFAVKEMVLMTALEVADQGGISDVEMKVLKEGAGILGLDVNKYL